MKTTEALATNKHLQRKMYVHEVYFISKENSNFCLEFKSFQKEMVFRYHLWVTGVCTATEIITVAWVFSVHGKRVHICVQEKKVMNIHTGISNSNVKLWGSNPWNF